MHCSNGGGLRLCRFMWPLKRHSSAAFGIALLRPRPAWLSHPLVSRPGHQSPRALTGQTPHDQKRLILRQNSPRGTGSAEDLAFFKAVVIRLTAPFEGLSLLHLERAGSLPGSGRRGPVKGKPAPFKKGSLNVLPHVSFSWKVKQKLAGGKKKNDGC